MSELGYGFDIIGDVHGRGSELEHLFQAMGYVQRDGYFRHTDRTAIFVGDYIDRGPEILKTLSIVRSMVDNGAAQAILGNHELNAMAFHTSDPMDASQHIRAHSKSNKSKIHETLSQLSNSQLMDSIEWLRSLPLWLELEAFRVIHACWDHSAIDLLQQFNGRPLTDDFVVRACKSTGDLHHAVDVILKGRKMDLPKGVSFCDSDNQVRRKARTRWFEDPVGHSYASYSLSPETVQCDQPLAAEVIQNARPYELDERLLFVGHYRLKASCPTMLAKNVVCVDWQPEGGRGLVAYRWSGESECDSSHFFYVTE